MAGASLESLPVDNSTRILTEEWSEKLAQCNWFANVGRDTLPGVERVDSWNAALQLIGGGDDPELWPWVQLQSEISNEMCTSLGRRDPAKFNTWNPIAHVLRDHVESMLNASLTPVLHAIGLPDIVGSACRSVVVSFLTFLAFGGSPESAGYYHDVVNYYLIGHFPCGYSGTYPNGKIIVY